MAAGQAADLRARAEPLLRDSLHAGVPMSAAAKLAAKQLGVSRKELYELALQVQARVQAGVRGGAAGPSAAGGGAGGAAAVDTGEDEG